MTVRRVKPLPFSPVVIPLIEVELFCAFIPGRLPKTKAKIINAKSFAKRDFNFTQAIFDSNLFREHHKYIEITIIHHPVLSCKVLTFILLLKIKKMALQKDAAPSCKH